MLGLGAMAVGESCGSAPGLQPCTNLPPSLTLACGSNPCGLWDNIYASQECIDFKLCSGQISQNEYDVLNQGLIAGGAEVIGRDVGQGAGNFVNAALIDPITGGINWTMIGLGAIALYFLLRK